MIIPLDPVGNVSLILQVAILFILILGLPFARGVGSNKNFVRHGYLTVLALALHTILIFIIMIPTFANGVGTITALPILNIFNVLSHAILGTTAEVLGFIVVGSWLAKTIKKPGMFKNQKNNAPSICYMDNIAG